jgi:hypothetical protein
MTENVVFYNNYADLPINQVPLEEIVHEIVFLRLLKKFPGLELQTMGNGVIAALELNIDNKFNTPREIFRFLEYTTFFTPTHC